ncbi:MAG: ATP-binding cassette domain-containing protein [Chloroflexi bacterium]|nr:ATP-binding cassette domain-containing protein [Chloroflexota bacterium]
MSNQPPPRVRLGYGGGISLTGEGASNSGKTVRRLLGYLKPYGRRLSLVAFLSLIGTLCRLAGPILIGWAIDRYIGAGTLEGLPSLVILLALVYIISGLSDVVQGQLMVTIGQRFVAELRSLLFKHIQTLSMAYHDHHSAGDLMSRVSNDTDAINQAISNGLIEFTSNILMLGGIMIAMFALNWQLALGTATLLPIMLGITAWVTQYSRKAFREVQTNLGTLNSVMEENIAGIRVVKAFAHEEATYAQFVGVNAQYKQAGVRADIITAALGPMFNTMNIIVIAAVALLGGWLALRGIVQVGVIATFVIYVRNFFQPMRAIAMLYNQLQSALAGAERIFTVLDAVPSVEDQPDAQPLPSVQGAVKFDDVSFEYIPDKPVLADVHMDIQPGQTIALVGPTGAGKTTIISLLSRFYDVTQGTISIDGQDIRTVQQASIREQLGIVLQNTFLFSGTILDNIRYGRLDASEAEIIAAAKLANADHFIQLLPQGYQTVVSEQGNNFSHGQRQLLAIARAVLADPRILILDEATSSVDTRTEVYIQEALLRLLEGRTAFVIAHRLSTIRNADLVLVVNDHRIIERGTHDELLAMKGFYYNLYMSQFSRSVTSQADEISA